MALSRVFLNVYFLRVLALLSLALLLYGGLRTQPVPMYTASFDKWTHLLGFAVVVVSFGLAFSWLNSVLLFLSMTLLGSMIEVAQSAWLPLRTFSWEDLLADVIGILLGLTLLMPLRLLYYWAMNKKQIDSI